LICKACPPHSGSQTAQTNSRRAALPLPLNYHLAEGKLLDCIKYIIFVKELRNILWQNINLKIVFC